MGRPDPRRRSPAPPPPEHGIPTDPADVERLVEQLRTYQLELELQNEELRRAEEESRGLRDQYADLFDNAPVGYCLLAEDGRVLAANHTAVELLAVGDAGPVGRSFLGYIATTGSGEARAALDEARHDHPTHCEVGVAHSGACVRLDICRQAERTDGDARAAALRVTLTDITRRVALEEQSRQYVRRTLTLQEAERRQVARDLHDGVNQILAVLRYRLADSPGESRTVEILDSAIQEVRRVSRHLHPMVLVDLGLEAALGNLCRHFSERAGLQIRLDCDPDLPDLDRDLEINIYRLVQEGLTNVERHAEAAHADVTLRQRGRGVRLEVTDDGRGFDVAAAAGGFGLSGLRERALLLGGETHVESRPGHGAKLRTDLPLRRRAEAKTE